MRFHIIAPDALLPFKRFVNLFYDFCQKGSRTCSGVEYLDSVKFFFMFAFCSLQFDLLLDLACISEPSWQIEFRL